MINSIINFCQSVNFKFNLFELVKGLLSLVLITSIILGIKKIMYNFNKGRRIDQRVRARRARFARVITEIGEYNGTLGEVDEVTQNLECREFIDVELTRQLKIEDTSPIIENVSPDLEEDIVPRIQEDSGKAINRKKTRAMSMEERWADFDKKRAKRNTA